VTVERIDRDGGRWRVTTDRGDVSARWVVVATGFDRVPVIPDWPGRTGFAGELLHSSQYHEPSAFRGRDVLVVGVGNSGSEIATHLARAGAARVRVSVRSPANMFRRVWFGIPSTVFAYLSRPAPVAVGDIGGRVLQRLMYGDLRPYGLAPAPYGVSTELRVKGAGPVNEEGFVDEVKAGRIEVVAAVQGLDGADVVLADGAHIRPDVVFAATGFRHGLEPLVGHLGVLDDAGRPLERTGRDLPAAPGLFFCGYAFPLSGQIPEMGRTARRISRRVAHSRTATFAKRTGNARAAGTVSTSA
jgi:cation diffusion facilitator CzcD-associated flavoprotein CzcO